MGYLLRVRFASFFAGAAVASAAGIYFLNKDYKMTHQSITQQMTGLSKSLEERISSLEKFKEAETVEAPKLKEAEPVEAPTHVEAAE